MKFLEKILASNFETALESLKINTYLVEATENYVYSSKDFEGLMKELRIKLAYLKTKEQVSGIFLSEGEQIYYVPAFATQNRHGLEEPEIVFDFNEMATLKDSIKS